MRIMGLCLAAVFALAAFAASSAFALPEVGRCLSSETGKYKNAGCTEKASATEKGNKAKFEWHKGAKSESEGVNFTGSSGASSLETESGTKIECTTSSASGKWDQDSGSIKEVEGVVATFKNCSLGVAKKACQSGVTSGEIVTKTLIGPIGYLKGKGSKTPEVGAELKPSVAKGKFAEFECEGFGKILVGEGTGKLGDCIIATVTSAVNVMTTTSTELYTGVKGPEGQEQNPQHFEGKTTHCNLESKLGEGGWERSVQRQEETLTQTEEPLEMKA